MGQGVDQHAARFRGGEGGRGAGGDHLALVFGDRGQDVDGEARRMRVATCWISLWRI
jgi:hypothetical protein